MKFVAFFRNLNLGRSPAPTRAQLESAFLSASATSAESFLTNGTLVFESNTRVNAEKVLKRACAVLQESNGFEEPAFLRELGYLAELVRRDPFASIDRAAVYEICVTFLHESLKLPPDPPYENRKKDVLGVEYTPSEFISVVYKLSASPGSPNAFIEKEFGCPSTTRAWNTVCRLVKKHVAAPTPSSRASRITFEKDGPMTNTASETLSVVVEREIPFPPEKIWRALTQPHLVEEWLMKNDFKPVVGHHFNLRADWGAVDCQVLAVEPNKTLTYTWAAYGLESVVTWTLTSTSTGTHLRMEQSGFRPDQQQAYHGAKGGWQQFFANLEQVVARID